MQVIGYENNNRVTVKQRVSGNHDDVKLCQALELLVNILLVDKPLWSFQVEQPYANNNRAVGLVILQDYEPLGTVQWVWSGGQHKYRIENDRINEARERGRGYITKDVSKAVLRIKKDFSKLSLSEKLEKAVERADDEMQTTLHRHHRDYISTKSAVEKKMVEYAQTHAHEAFLKHLLETDITAYNTVARRNDLYEEVQYMQRIRSDTASGNTLLVLREGSVYIVKSKGTVATYNDNDLPEYMRPKLGMLKLVEDKCYVTSVGFRVDETTFIVEGEKDEQQV